MLQKRRWRRCGGRLIRNEHGPKLAVGFKLKEVLPAELEAAARAGRRARGAGLRQLQGMGPTRFVLAVDNDNEFRSRCE